MVQCGAVSCSVMQCIAVCCSTMQCVAECCSALQSAAVYCNVLQCIDECYTHAPGARQVFGGYATGSASVILCASSTALSCS